MSQKTYWVYGIHSVETALNNPCRDVTRVCVVHDMFNRIAPLARSHNISNIEIVDKHFFTSTFGHGATHQGCAVMVRDMQDVGIEDVIVHESSAPIVILDQITDPHNIGAILRSAAVFGARAVVVQDAGAPKLTSTIAKVASGALEFVPFIRVTNISRTIKLLKDNMFWCVGLSEYGDKLLSEIDLKGKYAFIIGSEGSGMRRLTKESCDILARLPSTEQFSTLNAAQACTVTLYESFKQRCV